MARYNIAAGWLTKSGGASFDSFEVEAEDLAAALAKAERKITGDKRRRYAGKLDMRAVLLGPTAHT